MNTKATRRSQKQLLKRKSAETAAAHVLPDVPAIDCGTFDESQIMPLPEVPSLDCGTFDGHATEVVVPPPPTPVPTSAIAVMKGLKGGY